MNINAGHGVECALCTQREKKVMFLEPFNLKIVPQIMLLSVIQH